VVYDEFGVLIGVAMDDYELGGLIGVGRILAVFNDTIQCYATSTVRYVT